MSMIGARGAPVRKNTSTNFGPQNLGQRLSQRKIDTRGAFPLLVLVHSLLLGHDSRECGDKSSLHAGLTPAKVRAAQAAPRPLPSSPVASGSAVSSCPFTLPSENREKRTS